VAQNRAIALELENLDNTASKNTRHCTTILVKYLRCDWLFNVDLFEIYCWVTKWKNWKICQHSAKLLAHYFNHSDHNFWYIFFLSLCILSVFAVQFRKSFRWSFV